MVAGSSPAGPTSEPDRLRPGSSRAPARRPGTRAGPEGTHAIAAAIDRLLRFLATAPAVFERIEDRSGRIQGIYHRAADGVAPRVACLGDDDKAVMPDRLMARLGGDSRG